MICPRCNREIPGDAVLCCYCGRVFVRKKPTGRRDKGTGTIYKRGSTWTLRITVAWDVLPDGRLRRSYRTKGGFATKAEAAAYLADLKAQNERTKKAPSLQHYWELYKAGDLEKLSKSKAVAYKGAWKKLAALAVRPVDAITVGDLRRVVASKADTYYPARDMKNLLSHLFKLAGADGWTQKDLPEYIILPDKDEKERQPFTPEEQAALWKCYEDGCEDAALPLLMIYTGMMPGEMMNLRPEMIDLDARKIIGAGLKTKVRRESPIYLPAAVIPILSAALENLTPGGWVLHHSEAPFYRHYYAALEAAGVRRLEPYSCRHTTATALAIDRNIAPQTVQRIMRWSSTRMLDRYAHPDDADIITAIDPPKDTQKDVQAV